MQDRDKVTKANMNSYGLYRMALFSVTLGNTNYLKAPHFSHFGGYQPYLWNGCSNSRQILYIGYIKSQKMDDESPLKGAWLGSRDPF